MTERAKAIMQLKRARTATAAARGHLQAIGATPSITGTAATIEELTADLINYVVQAYRAHPEPVEDNTHTG